MRHLASLMVLALIGCGGGSGGGGGNGSADSGEEEFVYAESNDRSQCEGPAQFRSPFGSWHSDFKGSGKKTGRQGTMRIRFNFLESKIELSNQCLVAGRYGYAFISVPISVDENKRVIQILQDQQYMSESEGVRCGLIIKKASLFYETIGRCLKMSNDNGVQYLVAD